MLPARFPTSKGQGSLEYLLIIAGAIVLAALAIFFLLTAGSQTQTSSNEANRRAGIAKACEQTCAFIDQCAHYSAGDAQQRVDACSSECKAYGYDHGEVSADTHFFNCDEDAAGCLAGDWCPR